jgi:predicted ester cyclase
MSTESNKSVLRNVFQIMMAGNSADVEKYFTSDWVNHDPSVPPMQGYEGARQLIQLWNSGFSNLKVQIEEMVSEGDLVAGRFRITGTHTGSLMGVPPSGKNINMVATGIFRVVDNKLKDNWVNIDALGLLQQIGAVPAPKM